MEYAGGGQLLEFLLLGERFSERVARYFFLQFLKGLEIVHRNGYAHRDLKPDNIMLDKDYNVKIIDFGFAGAIAGKNGKKLMSTYCGTPYFMSPEIKLALPYSGEAADIFAAGVTLFMMHAKAPPFTSATTDDRYYKMIAKDRADYFWMTHQQHS
jgi:serine/threonine protein kinase